MKKMVDLSDNAVEKTDRDQDLAESEHKFRTLFEESIDGIVLGKYQEGGIQFVDCNPRMAAIFRGTREDILKSNPATLSPATQADGQDSAALAMKYIESALAGEHQFFEWQHLRFDGTPFHSEVVVNRVDIGGEPHLMGIVRDITKRKDAEEALLRSEEKFRLAMEATEDGLWDWNIETNEVYYSPSWARILDETEVSGVYETWEEKLHPEDRPDIHESLQEHLAGHSPIWRMEYRLRTKNGDYKWVVGRGKVVRRAPDGHALRMVGTMADITERKEQEDQRLKLETQIQHTQKLESLGVLAGGIAHDFNNLLMAVLGNADLALQDLPENSSVRKNLRRIEQTAHRAADLTRQMLAYSGKGHFLVRPIDVNELINEMGHLLDAAVSKKARIARNLDEGAPLIQADTAQIQQVVINLITNASEAIEKEKEGEIILSTGTKYCDAAYLSQCYLGELNQEGTYVFVEVRDNGCGMDAGAMGRMFDPFFTTKFMGRGLGLAAVLGIVRGHAGAIQVQSEVGEGSVFRLLFPVPASLDASRDSRGAGGTRRGRNSGKVLLADDEDVVLDVGKEMLERSGYEVLTAIDGHEAVEIFRSRRDEIRCVILDLAMPRMSGDEALKEIRRIDPGALVIISSGYDEQDVGDQFKGMGVSAIIHKPYNRASLESLMKRVLDKDA